MVINDYEFIKTLPKREIFSGLAEAIKVALIKDKKFFYYIENNIEKIKNNNEKVLQTIIEKCAILHLDHIINNKDPFEKGSSRPLDFGHWLAHKLEDITEYKIRHGEAVIIGMALDCTYAYFKKLLDKDTYKRVLSLFINLGYNISPNELKQKSKNGTYKIEEGLNEFREHMGGELTLIMITDIGKIKEIHTIDKAILRKSIENLYKKII